MGFKTCSQDEFERAMNKFDKLNRRNKTQHKTLSLAEQIKQLDELEERQRKEALERKLAENRPRFSPIYDAKMKTEQKEKQRLEQEAKKKGKK